MSYNTILSKRGVYDFDQLLRDKIIIKMYNLLFGKF